MVTVATLGGHANAPCPKCSHRFITFFSGDDPFISEVKKFTSDSVIQLRCPIHGEFAVRAGEFRDRLG